MLGFGGLYKGNSVNHCFPLNGNEANPECEGVRGILDIYKEGN